MSEPQKYDIYHPDYIKPEPERLSIEDRKAAEELRREEKRSRFKRTLAENERHHQDFDAIRKILDSLGIPMGRDIEYDDLELDCNITDLEYALLDIRRIVG